MKKSDKKSKISKRISANSREQMPMSTLVGRVIPDKKKIIEEEDDFEFADTTPIQCAGICDGCECRYGCDMSDINSLEE